VAQFVFSEFANIPFYTYNGMIAAYLRLAKNLVQELPVSTDGVWQTIFFSLVDLNRNNFF
jgi:hypothetical protein